MQPSKKPKVFYGYWILVAAFLCIFTHSGCGYYAFSLFVTPLQTDFGWGRGETMAAFTIFYLVWGVSSPLVGRIVDRYGARVVISSGAIVAGLGFTLLSQMHQLWHFYAGYILAGVGMSSIGPVPTSALVSNWFKKRRGTAMGIMSTGFGGGGLALGPVIGGYLIPNLGWRTSYLILALIVVVLIIPLALLVIRTKPADIGLYPDGIKAPEIADVSEAHRPTAKGLTLGMALATPTFWLIGASFLTASFGQGGVVQSQVPHLEDIGFPAAAAASAIGAAGLGSLIGKFFFGWLCDQIPAKYAWCIALSLQLTGLAILINVGATSSLALIWLYAILIGLGGGSWLPPMSILVSTTFGLASYGTIFGMLNLLQGVSAATGPLVAGYMYDTTNTYKWAFIIFLILGVVAMTAILMVRRRKSA